MLHFLATVFLFSGLLFFPSALAEQVEDLKCENTPPEGYKQITYSHRWLSPDSKTLMVYNEKQCILRVYSSFGNLQNNEFLYSHSYVKGVHCIAECGVEPLEFIKITLPEEFLIN